MQISSIKLDAFARSKYSHENSNGLKKKKKEN